MAQLKDLLVNGDARTLGTLYGNHGAVISGRAIGSGDDEGLIIGLADNGYAGVCLGNPGGVRSVFYLNPTNQALWRYNNGTSGADIVHPGKAGTIALTSDITDKNVKTAPQSSDTIFVTGTGSSTATTGTLQYNTGVTILKNGGVLMGAAWNDYAEYRNQEEEIEPGYCVKSADNGKVSKTTEKYAACDGIVSDTFGFSIGKTDACQTPLAVAGRVLAYFEGNREDYHAGDTVCAGPNGKVMKMTREEIKEYPDRIVGLVSEIPEYETWGQNDIKVNGRIWIKIK